MGTQGICQGRHPGKLHKATLLHCAPSFFRKRRQTIFFYKVVFFGIWELRTFTCSSCNIVIQPTIVHRVSGTYIVPLQCLGLPPSTPKCFGNNDCSSTVLVERRVLVNRRVFGSLRMATPRGGRGVTIGPDTCHSDFFLCHQTSGIRISYPSSTESHMEPSLDYIFLFIQKWTLSKPPKYMLQQKIE